MSLTVGGQTDRIEKQLAENQAVLDRRRIERHGKHPDR